MHAIKAAIVGVSLIAVAQLAAATNCKGNACDVVIVKKQGDCVVLANRSDQRVKVKVSFYIYTVYAQSEMTPRDTQGQCWTGMNNISATYG